MGRLDKTSQISKLIKENDYHRLPSLSLLGHLEYATFMLSCQFEHLYLVQSNGSYPQFMGKQRPK